MKFIKNILTVLLVMGFVSSCDLDLQVDPNEISPEQASLEDLYNRIQLDMMQVFEDAEFNPGSATRMYMSVAFNYNAFSPPQDFNGLWRRAYNQLFPNIDALLTISEGKGLDIHVGTAMIMKAYTLMILVDLIGDVPYTEAGQGVDIISPKTDPGADVYAAAISMLDDAIALLTGTVAAAPAFDNFYGGDADKWITVANTLKMRAYLNMGDMGSFNAITNFIDDASEDFEWHYGISRTNPDSRHPNYQNHYETGDGAYMSNYYMWLLLADKEDTAGVAIVDPRIRYYFYRKVDDAFAQDATTYSCHFSSLPDQSAQPAHFAAVDTRMPYCVLEFGYSGRDHLNGEGIPPDGPIRTSWGLYPFGGDFDDSSFEDTRESGTTGGGGQGISPLMSSSFVYFMRAEAALSGASGDPRQLMIDGINASLDKVEGFEGLVANKMGTDVPLKNGDPSGDDVKEVFGMSDSTKLVYIDQVLIMYDAPGANQKAIVVKEFYIAAWGNGLEAYNMYRRTGYPDNIMPALETQPGVFPLSFFYPSDSETRNINITQKGSLGESVFWQNAGVAAGLY